MPEVNSGTIFRIAHNLGLVNALKRKRSHGPLTAESVAILCEERALELREANADLNEWNDSKYRQILALRATVRQLEYERDEAERRLEAFKDEYAKDMVRAYDTLVDQSKRYGIPIELRAVAGG